MKVKVQVFRSVNDMYLYISDRGDVDLVADYVCDHSCPDQRRRLGEGCRDAFEAGQAVVTYPLQIQTISLTRLVAHDGYHKAHYSDGGCLIISANDAARLSADYGVSIELAEPTTPAHHPVCWL